MRRLLLLIFVALSSSAMAEEQNRTTEPFDKIHVSGPIKLRVDASKPHSITVSGTRAYMQRVSTVVENGLLTISYPVRENQKLDDTEMDIVVNMPGLTRLSANSAGEIVLTNIRSNRLDLHYRGAGRLEARGKVKKLTLGGQGVGEIDMQRLLAETVDVNFTGIGEVKVYASKTLNASLNGLGDFTYYGNPDLVKKTGLGLGEFRAGL